MMDRGDFAKFMAALSRAIPRFAPSLDNQALTAVWHAELGHLSHEQLNAAYKAAIRTFDQFPSIREVLALIGQTEQTDEDKGREVGERIWAAIARYGSVNGNGDSARQKLADISAYIGAVGDEVVRMQGGWNHICEVATFDNATTLKAQWRQLAEVISRKARSGDLFTAPTLPSAPKQTTHDLIAAAVNQAVVHLNPNKKRES